MATFDAAYANILLYDGSTFTVSGDAYGPPDYGPFHVADDNGGALDVDDTITFTNDSTGGSNPASYVGHTADGVIVHDSDGTYLLVSSTPLSDGATLTQGTDWHAESFVVCFLAGTGISTPQGQRPVEELAIGDEVLTASGEARRILWVGRQSIVTMFADKLRQLPIRFLAGSLDQGVPARDLFLSPGHALLLDGLLVHAGALVNGASISRHHEVGPRFTYYHIELEDHALILAEGAPAETFVDNVSRARFDNFAEFEALYGATREEVAELEQPRVRSARQLPAGLRRRLDARAAALGFATVAAA